MQEFKTFAVKTTDTKIIQSFRDKEWTRSLEAQEYIFYVKDDDDGKKLFNALMAELGR